MVRQQHRPRLRVRLSRLSRLSRVAHDVIAITDKPWPGSAKCYARPLGSKEEALAFGVRRRLRRLIACGTSTASSGTWAICGPAVGAGRPFLDGAATNPAEPTKVGALRVFTAVLAREEAVEPPEMGCAGAGDGDDVTAPAGGAGGWARRGPAAGRG